MDKAHLMTYRSNIMVTLVPFHSVIYHLSESRLREQHLQYKSRQTLLPGRCHQLPWEASPS